MRSGMFRFSAMSRSLLLVDNRSNAYESWNCRLSCSRPVLLGTTHESVRSHINQRFGDPEVSVIGVDPSWVSLEFEYPRMFGRAHSDIRNFSVHGYTGRQTCHEEE